MGWHWKSGGNPGNDRKLPGEKAEKPENPFGMQVEAFSEKIREMLEAEISGTSGTLPPLFEGLDRDGKLLMLRLLLTKKLGKQKAIILAWGEKPGGRNHDRYKMASEIFDLMVQELNQKGCSEENNWRIE